MKNFCFYLSLCVMLIISACQQERTPSTSTAPAAAPEKTTSETVAPVNEDFTYVPGEYFGKLTGSTLEGDLKFLYGKDIVPVEISLGEGFMAPGYRLFPGTAKEADLVFPLEASSSTGISVIVNREDTEWRMLNGSLTVGTPLTELERMNGKPFIFLGYEWDYSGTIINWNDGKLSRLGGTLSFPEILPGKDFPAELMGDTEVRSDSPLLEGMGIFIREIIVNLEAPVINEDGIPAQTDFAIVPGYRFGALTASVTPEDLPLVYGVGNVEPMDYDLDGGVSVPGFRLFAGTKNEVEIGFPDEDNYLEVVEIRISKAGSDWHLAGTDLRVGDRLSEVRAANQQPFKLYDHNMEGGGRVMSWEGGRLVGTGFQFNTTKEGKTYNYDDEHNVSSDAQEVKKSNPEVEMITISLER